MRRALKTLSVVSAVVASLVVVLVGLVVAGFLWPSLLLNAVSLRVAAAMAATQGIYLQWDHAEVHATSQHIWIKSLELRLTHVCAQLPAYHLSTCLPEVYAAVSVDVHPDHLRVVNVGPVRLIGQQLALGPMPDDVDANPSPIDWARIPRPLWLRGTQLQAVQIEWQEVSVQGSGWRVDGGMQLRVTPLAPDQPSSVTPSSADISLHIAPFCLRQGPVTLDGCVGAGDAKVRLAVINDQFTLTQLGPLDVKASTLSLRWPDQGAAPASGPQSSQAQNTTWTLPPVLQFARFLPMRIQVDAWQLQRGTLAVSGGLDVNLVQQGETLVLGAKLGKSCAEESSLGMHGCFAKVQGEVTAALRGGILSLAQVGPLEALGGELRIKRDAVPKPAAATSSSFNLGDALSPTSSLVPAWLQSAHLAPVRVELGPIDLVQDDRHIIGGVTLEGQPIGDRAQWRLDVNGKGDGKGPLHTAVADVRLTSGQGHFSGPWRLQAQGLATLNEGGEVVVKATTRNLAPGVVEFHLQTATKKEEQRAVADLAGTLNERGVSAELAGSLVGVVPNVQRLTLDACRINLGWHHAWPDQGQLDLGCGVGILLERLPHQDEVPLDWPSSIKLQLSAAVSTPLPPSTAGAVQGALHLDLVPITTREFTAASNTALTVSGDLSALPHSLHMYVDSTTDLNIPDFGALVKSLGASKYAVPAPLNALRGNIWTQVRGSGDLGNGGIEVPLTLGSRLKSGEAGKDDVQHLDTNIVGMLHLDPLGDAVAPQLEVKAELSDVQLALPRITLADGAAPQLFPDKRMRSSKAARAEAVSRGVLENQHPDILVGPPAPAAREAFKYQVEVTSPRTNPVHLVSNLAKAPIPIAVAVTAGSDTAPRGHALVREFPLNLFRRQAYVDRFDLEFLSPQAAPTIDGKLRVEYTDYTITILILGTLKAPQVVLSSQPPRPQNQLIAVLLFGKEMNELDDDQLKSVDNFGGAAADGALSLASMYLLASTPVQSVGYNPQSHAFTAKITIGKGTSVNIGSDLGDYQKLGVQKRLARDWSVETYIERNTDADSDAVTALLEWSRRF